MRLLCFVRTVLLWFGFCFLLAAGFFEWSHVGDVSATKIVRSAGYKIDNPTSNENVVDDCLRWGLFAGGWGLFFQTIVSIAGAERKRKAKWKVVDIYLGETHSTSDGPIRNPQQFL